MTTPELFELAELLLKCPVFSDSGRRATLIANLPPDVKNSANTSGVPKEQVLNILRSYLLYYNSLDEFLKVVRFFEGNSFPFQVIEKWVAKHYKSQNTGGVLLPDVANQPASLFRVFVSRLEDVNDERLVVFEALERLPARTLFRGRVGFETSALRPAECDVVIVLLWSQIGQPYSLNGQKYASSTHYEILDSVEKEHPHIYVYHRSVERAFTRHENENRIQNEARADFIESETFRALVADKKINFRQHHTVSDFREIFEADLERLTFDLLLKQAAGQTVPGANPVPAPSIKPKIWQGSPFPGLRSFKKEDAPIFFGRERETDALVRKVAENRFVAMVGASGSGKSSLVGAGLLPRLEANAIPGETNATGSKDWRIISFVPGGNQEQPAQPFAALFDAVCATFECIRPQPLDKRRAKTNFIEDMLGDSATLREALLDALDREKASPETQVLFFLDQFEELFTTSQPATVAPFVAMLEMLAKHPRTRVIVTIRHDFVHRAIDLTGLAELFQEPFILPAPNRAALRQMIKRPAEVAALEFEDADLVEKLLDDTGNEPGSLALLAYALDELYKVAVKRGDNRLTFADYEDLEGVQGAIGRRAEDTFKGLVGDEAAKEQLLGQVFRLLVEVDERGTATRRRAKRESFDAPQQALADAFIQARLLVADADHIEVAHETLFRSWEWLKKWIEEAQEDFILERQVRNAAEEWEAKKRHPDWYWPQERLKLVYAMVKRHKPDWGDMKAVMEAFIEPEQTRLLRKINDPATTHRERRDIGDRLSVIGDTRFGVGLDKNGVPEICWLPVAPGGQIEIEGRLFKVQPFFIAKYLVTYQQYTAFVEAEDGFENLNWWEGMPEKYHKQNLSLQNMQSWNNPRDSISWYQSVAFARWLNKRLRGHPITDENSGLSMTIGPNAEVRLPTEWEWQWAARGGGARREYPWGEWRDGYANTNEAGMNRAIGVGLYPQGAAACGALDMSGNLREWCLNKYELQPDKEERVKKSRLPFESGKPAEDPIEELCRIDSNNSYRVLRGGSFYDDSHYASAVYRYFDFPFFVSSYFGVRVVVGVPL